jgi:hypothetical protein
LTHRCIAFLEISPPDLLINRDPNVLYLAYAGLGIAPKLSSSPGHWDLSGKKKQKKKKGEEIIM